MKKISSVLAMAVLLSSGVSAAEEPVEVSFIDNGGLNYKVNPSGFTISNSFGSFQGGGYLVPRDSKLRNGCFITTPWLQVNHGNGQALAFPHFTLEWWGDLHPVQHIDQTVLRLQLEVKRPNGTTSQVRSYVHTGLMTLQPRAYYPDGWVSYYGRLDNPSAQGNTNFGSISVNNGDEVRYSVCDLYEGGKLLVNDVQVTTYPVF
ncbi:hypothetical protein [Melittangium boletus]|uniref:Uncharacterized protein n=1 Tax=Melittangium boletus DSM 14713 TaxID=1294270 RepID=A0A250IMK0_9BACT|nr:hypothetical protein [Melittangium boletus]ATB32979.1 hypothetical protein MEBOL_006468 [Melittangium boletus DSM 14713]